ncbi:50S ribosomal L2, chloroplastic [Gossypium arboreum]|uniref:50S ribosomal L2, chloroplastic n=1 Tax=Gossypium arboreum TaxID=29729 RepID=A0A0B0NQF0_GOSAR|nr:50S ribosomal L2, chloroplastic [Gossypium arboreum]
MNTGRGITKALYTNAKFGKKEGHCYSHGRNPLPESSHFPSIRVRLSTSLMWASSGAYGSVEASDVRWWCAGRGHKQQLA